ncbi:hypothetical protein EMIHUDRAFT_454304 [Emiliania huxleyi CCMP1516]|uniref:Phytanoyl-CoA dioxygenase n=2 Tax=Emiliania huxleyi TaxID=2903 RepID=A0A0D3KWJ2_EMIH1|nr:hypothetical protein EMIHUDRAFT_454304 [Emiliania huxleyi CCMP1516]EOD40127.1 hypothetical protein EMIHUDRAFT_454304 [Emiliania huxleyi CCMP1516]|eukprot:XP_005792556.1 hypothetical protein EMIHUDRAFT_454304 [Emiliania huxleyi CCMP1516]
MANGLCSDEAVQRFVVSGFVQLPPSTAVPPAAHAEIAAQIHRCGVQEAGGPEDARAGRRDPYGLRQLDGDAAGNNLLHAAPALRGPAFLESPHLVATLTRLLGPEYRLHPHCRGHLRKRGAKTSMWHVDAYKGLPWCSGRLHEPHWCMVMYYPQDTTPEMGPTQLLPGTQFYRGDSDRAHYSRGHIPSFGEQLAGWATCVHTVTGPAGTVVVMHYDLWHRALAAASDAPRLMLKRLFSSAVAAAKKEAADGSALPPTPTHLMPALLAWLAPRCAALVQRAAARERRALFVRERRPVWRHVWAWLHGQAAAPRLVSPARATRLSGTLRIAAEPARLRAAYELAQATAAEAAEALLAVVSDAGAATSVRRTAAYGLSAASCVSAAQCERLLFLAAGSDGAEGFDAELLLAAADPAAEIRYLAAIVLARATRLADSEAVPCLERALAVPAAQLACQGWGASLDSPPPPPSARLEVGGEVVGALAAALSGDADRYVRGYAADALVSLLVHGGSDAARAALEAALGDLGTVAVLQGQDQGLADARARCRSLCARRWCPLTTPLSPF